MTSLAFAGGMATVGGVLLLAAGWRRRPQRPRRLSFRQVDLPVDRVAAATVSATVVLLLTRWVVAAAGAAVGAWFASGWWRARGRVPEEKRAEAIALWVEMLRDTVGTAQGLEGVVAVTASTAPMPIRSEVERMARRLQENVSLDQVLAEGGDDLDHPVSDLAITALRLNATAGGGKLREVLDDVAWVAHGEADVHRRLEVARSKPRAQMRYVALAIAASVTLLTVLAGDYLAPYRTVGGQVVLMAIGVSFVASFVWMERLGRIHTVERFLKSSKASKGSKP